MSNICIPERAILSWNDASVPSDTDANFFCLGTTPEKAPRPLTGHDAGTPHRKDPAGMKIWTDKDGVASSLHRKIVRMQP